MKSNDRLRSFVELTRQVFRAHSTWLPTRAETSKACDAIHLTLLKHVWDTGSDRPDAPPAMKVEHSGLQIQGRLLSDGATAEVQVAIRLLYYMDGSNEVPLAVDLYSRKSMKESEADYLLGDTKLHQSLAASAMEDDAVTLLGSELGSDKDLETAGKRSSVAKFSIMPGSRLSRATLPTESGTSARSNRSSLSMLSLFTGCFGGSPTSTAPPSKPMSKISLGSNPQ